MAYWLIKGKRKELRDPTAVYEGVPQEWGTGHALPGWNRGDRLFMWAGAPRLRVVAIATLEVPDAGFAQGTYGFGIRYLTDLFDGPTITTLRENRITSGAYFLKAGPAGTVYPLSDAQGREMDRLSERDRQRTGLPTQGEIEARLDGAGFGSSTLNRRIERIAIDATIERLTRSGWTVRSRERDGVGYDLECTRATRVLRVEVKGLPGVLSSSS